MIIGVPKEIKEQEFRVSITPEGVASLTALGHEVVVERGAGSAVGYLDEDYVAAGAKIGSREETYSAALVVKVKEPIPSEYGLLTKGQILFCFLHLAANQALTEVLKKQKVTAIAFETVTDAQGRLPLLTPMSEIAGRIAVQAGAAALYMEHGGRGVLLGGVPGVKPAKVVVIGGGTVGTEAAKLSMGLGADVTVLDNNLNRLRELQEVQGLQLKTRYSTVTAVAEEVAQADLVIGSVLIPGQHAPRLVTEEMVKMMRPGSAIVDVAIDQGGCCATSRPTTHLHPTYIEHGVVHYCVTNMPGACSRTGTTALANATLPYIIKLATRGMKGAFAADPGFAKGLNVAGGAILNPDILHAPA